MKIEDSISKFTLDLVIEILEELVDKPQAWFMDRNAKMIQSIILDVYEKLKRKQITMKVSSGKKKEFKFTLKYHETYSLLHALQRHTCASDAHQAILNAFILHIDQKLK